MDMSVIEGEDKQINVNNVTDYIEEIHTYLREMEASNYSTQT